MECIPQHHADVLAAEQQFWAQAHPPAFLEPAFARGAPNVIEPPGSIPREEVVAPARKSPGWTDVAMSDLPVRKLQLPHSSSSLVVCPASLLDHWRREAARFTPQLRTPDGVALVYHATARRKGADAAEPYHGTLCSVYVRRDDDGKLALSCHLPWKPREESAHE